MTNISRCSLPARVLVATTVFLCAAAVGEERRQLDAHEHGVTVMNAALDGAFLTVELEGAAINFVGFEHAPGNSEQTQAINDALATLEREGAQLLTNRAAECELAEATARHVTEDDHEDSDPDHHDHGHHDDEKSSHESADGEHAEFVARYRYQCARPERLAELRVVLFERFPLTNEINVSFLGPNVQTYKKLTPADAVLNVQD